MNNLFKEIQPGEMILAVSSFKLKGKAKYVFAMLNILTTTKIIEQDKDWWQVRAQILANDNDRQSLPENLQLRRN